MRKYIMLIVLMFLSITILSACNMLDVDLVNYRRDLNAFSESIENLSNCSGKINNLIANTSFEELDVLDSGSLDEDIEQIHDKQTNNELQNNEEIEVIEEMTNEKIDSTADSNTKANDLFNLSNEILIESETYKDLIDKISSAILETETLINDYADKKITLNTEQKMFLDQEIQKLKLLTRKLSTTATRLSIITSNLDSHDIDMDSLTTKYLLVLDNLINNNEMLEAGLNSINMMRYISNFGTNLPDGTRGRIMYGFRENNNPPVTKEFLINDDGTIQEESNDSNEILNEEIQKDESIAQKSNSWLKPNIDTYYNNNLENNIDTFFNTALLDNQFMYGRNNYGMAPYMNYLYNYQMNQATRNPYINNNIDTVDSMETKSNTQDVEPAKPEVRNNKAHKKLLTKNIDTYKSDDNITIGEKLKNFKKKISNIFNPKAEYPVYQFQDENE